MCVFCIYRMHSTITKPFGTTSMVNRIAFDFNFNTLYTRRGCYCWYYCSTHSVFALAAVAVVAVDVFAQFSLAQFKFSSALLWVPFALVWVFCFIVGVFFFRFRCVLCTPVDIYQAEYEIVSISAMCIEAQVLSVTQTAQQHKHFLPKWFDEGVFSCGDWMCNSLPFAPSPRVAQLVVSGLNATSEHENTHQCEREHERRLVYDCVREMGFFIGSFPYSRARGWREKIDCYSMIWKWNQAF